MNGRVKAPTIHDVAARAGVSRATVSRHINGGHNVSDRSSQAIAQAIQETGYQVNGPARSLRNSRSDTIAFLLMQNIDSLFSDPVHALLARECNRELSARQLSMVIVMASDADEQSRAMDYVLSGHVDGVLAVGLGDGGAKPAFKLADRGVPIVSCDGSPLYTGKLSTVGSDAHSGVKSAVEMLRQEGRCRIGYLGGPNPVPDEPRLAGFRAGMGAELDEDLIVGGSLRDPIIPPGVSHLVDRGAEAIVCVNDRVASQVISQLQVLGHRVPEDVAVVGYDNLRAICESSTPTITSVAQDFTRIAHELVDLLEAATNGEEPVMRLLPMQLVRRESA